MITDRLKFRKSTRSGPNDGACIEVAMGSDAVGVRDSKVPFGSEADHILTFSPEQFASFRNAIKDGQF